MAPNGSFVVVWRGDGEDGAGTGIFGQRFTSLGAPAGSEFRVNSYTTNNEGAPAVAMSPASGDFVVVWTTRSAPAEAIDGIFGQRFSSAGVPLGTEFRVNTFTTDYQTGPSVAADSAGRFIVAWTSIPSEDGSGYGVFGQRYDATGAPLGTEFLINGYATGNQAGPNISINTSGEFVVVWSSIGQDLSGSGVFGRRFASTGAKLGTEFRANTFTFMAQYGGVAAFTAAGQFLVAWAGPDPLGSSPDVYAQRFCFEPLSSVSVTTMGSLDVCPSGLGGTATVNDVGGGSLAHQWVYRTSPGGSSTNIVGQTGMQYVVNGAHFNFGTPGTYYLYCLTTPSCGSPTYSTEIATVTVSADSTAPVVSSPSSLTTTQTLCQ
jgi:hypothetical protein